MRPSSTVTFDVGGTTFKVSRSLLERYPDTMLARMVSSHWRTDDETPVFIERDGQRFKHVLDFMREGSVCLPAFGVSKTMFLKDLEYYGFENVDADNIHVECSISDSVKCVRSVETKYFESKVELDDFVTKNTKQKEAQSKTLEQEHNFRKQVLKDEFEQKERELKEEFAKMESETKRSFDVKQGQLYHRQACLEVAHFFYKRLQADITLVLAMGLSKRSNEKLQYDLDLRIKGSFDWQEFFDWVMSLGDGVKHDQVLKESLEIFGLEVDKCSTEENPKDLSAYGYLWEEHLNRGFRLHAREKQLLRKL